MNDRFLVVKYMESFICSIEDMVVNFPKKDYVIKTRIISDSLDILELIYLGNSIEDNKEIKLKILSKLSMLDFYLERSYKNKIISEKVFNKKSNEIGHITKLIYGWIRSESKC